MAKTLRIKLDTSQYHEPTEEEIRDAKDYVLRMSEYSDLFGDYSSYSFEHELLSENVDEEALEE